VTIVEEDSLPASCELPSPVEATLSAVFDDDMAARELTTLNDDMVVMVQCSVIFVDERGHPGDDRFASRYIDRKAKSSKLDSRIDVKLRRKGGVNSQLFPHAQRGILLFATI
jgi:hypothetical protein